MNSYEGIGGFVILLTIVLVSVISYAIGSGGKIEEIAKMKKEAVAEAAKELRIQAVKDGVARWKVIDEKGTTKFEWVFPNNATISESLSNLPEK